MNPPQQECSHDEIVYSLNQQRQYEYVRIWFKDAILPPIEGSWEKRNYFETTALEARFQGAALVILDRSGVNHFFPFDSVSYFTVEPTAVVEH